jgi:hypothetical protein
MRGAWSLIEPGIDTGVTMSDPLERATSSAPPILGEGCTQRYDPEALNAEDGTEFADAAELWRQLHQAESPAQKMDTQK